MRMHTKMVLDIAFALILAASLFTGVSRSQSCDGSCLSACPRKACSPAFSNPHEVNQAIKADMNGSASSYQKGISAMVQSYAFSLYSGLFKYVPESSTDVIHQATGGIPDSELGQQAASSGRKKRSLTTCTTTKGNYSYSSVKDIYGSTWTVVTLASVNHKQTFELGQCSNGGAACYCGGSCTCQDQTLQHDVLVIDNGLGVTPPYKFATVNLVKYCDCV